MPGDLHLATTSCLEVAYFDQGVTEDHPIFLLHGWPDSAVSWEPVSAVLRGNGFRTITPYLRGSFPTQFLSQTTKRFAGAVAMAQDLMELADILGLQKFSIAGHDWGARIAYTVAALFPERVRSISALALAFQPRAQFRLGSFEQSRFFWYQFFQCTLAGAEAVRNDPVGFARIQWDTWSPSGWFSENDFRTASEHFSHPDWAEITLNAYRSRYLDGEVVDLRYQALQEKLETIGEITVPTLMIQGADDTCDVPTLSEHQQSFFPRGYKRLVIPAAGHFPHREVPQAVADAVLQHERRYERAMPVDPK